MVRDSRRNGYGQYKRQPARDKEDPAEVFIGFLAFLVVFVGLIGAVLKVTGKIP